MAEPGRKSGKMKHALIVSFFFLWRCFKHAAPPNDGQIEFNRFYSNGSVVYQVHCCELPRAIRKRLQVGSFPSPCIPSTLKNNKSVLLACQLNNGLKGKITILNKEFEGEMPASKLVPFETGAGAYFSTISPFRQQTGQR